MAGVQWVDDGASDVDGDTYNDTLAVTAGGANRSFVLVVGSRAVSSNVPSVQSATLGGAPGVVDIERITVDSPNSTSATILRFSAADMTDPLDTALDLVLTFADPVIRAAWILYESPDPIAPHDAVDFADVDAVETDRDVTLAIEVPEDGAVVAGAFTDSASGQGTITWTGLTEDADDQVIENFLWATASVSDAAANSAFGIAAELDSLQDTSSAILVAASYFTLPIVVRRIYQPFPTADDSFSIDITGFTPGNLGIIAVVTNNTAGTTAVFETLAGWTEIDNAPVAGSDQGLRALWAKVIAVGETNPVVLALDQAVNHEAEVVYIEISNWSGSLTDGFDVANRDFSTGHLGTTETPPPLTPPWDASVEHTLWIIGILAMDDLSSVSGWPTGYAVNGSFDNNDAGINQSAMIGTSYRYALTATETPGVVSLDDSESVHGFTIAVRPKGAASGIDTSAAIGASLPDVVADVDVDINLSADPPAPIGDVVASVAATQSDVDAVIVAPHADVLAILSADVSADIGIVVSPAQLAAAIQSSLDAEAAVVAPGTAVDAGVNASIDVSIALTAPLGQLTALMDAVDVDADPVVAPNADVLASVEVITDAELIIAAAPATLVATVTRPTAGVVVNIGAPMGNLQADISLANSVIVDLDAPVGQMDAEAESANGVTVSVVAPDSVVDTDISVDVELAVTIDPRSGLVRAFLIEPGEISLASLVDAKYNTLRQLFPAGPPTISDLTVLWLRSEGGTGNTLSDLWYTMLIGKGATPGRVNDMWFEVLGNNGFTQDNVQSRELAFWQAGGNLA